MARLGLAQPKRAFITRAPVHVTEEVEEPRPKVIVKSTAQVPAAQRRQLTRVITSRSPQAPPVGPVSVDLTPADTALIGVVLTATPGAVTINLTPAETALVGVTVSPTPGSITINLTPAATALIGATLTTTPGAVTVNLTPTSLPLIGVAVNPQPVAVPIPRVMVRGLREAPQRRQIITPVIDLGPPQLLIALDLNPADLGLTGVALTPTPGAVTASLTPAAFSFDGVSVSPVGAAAPVPRVVVRGFIDVPQRRRLVPPSVIRTPAIAPPGTVNLNPADLGLTGVALTPLGIAIIPRTTVQLTAHETAYRRRVEQAPGPTVLRAPTAPPGTITLTPANTGLIGVALTPTPGTVTTNLNPSVVQFTGVTLPATPGAVTASLTPADLPLTGVPVVPTPGVVTTSLTPADLPLIGVALAPLGVEVRPTRPIVELIAHEAAWRRRVEQAPGPTILRAPTAPPGTVALIPAELPLVGVALAPLGVEVRVRPAAVNLTAHETAYRRRVEQAPGPTILRTLIQPVTVSLTPADVVFIAPALNPGGAGFITLTPAGLPLTAVAVTPTPGQVTTSLTPASLGLVGVTVPPTPGPVTIVLTPGTVALTGRALNPVQGNGNPTLTPAALALTARSLVSTPGPLSTTLTRASLALIGVPLGPRPMVQLTPAGLAFTGRPVAPQPGAPAVPLTPALLILDAGTLLPIPGGTALLLEPATLTFVAVTIHIGPLPKVPYAGLRPLQPGSDTRPLQPPSTDLRPLQPPAHRRFPP
jgi:hypothetical protein